MSSRREHWEQVHQSKREEERSWFQARPEMSLALFDLAGCDPSSRVIDVGGGTSHLVDLLIGQGYRHVTVLDIASKALDEAKERLGDRADQVRWVQGDVTSVRLESAFDMWHDRAVFHFLTEKEDRAAYVRTLKKSLDTGGHAIVATFAEDGPTHCSGLPVVRYSSSSLLAELGPEFALIEARHEVHRTPSAREQSFQWCLFQRS